MPNGGIDKALSWYQSEGRATMTRIGLRVDINLDEYFMGMDTEIALKFKQVIASIRQELKHRVYRALLESQKDRNVEEKKFGAAKTPMEIRKALEDARDDVGGVQKELGWFERTVQTIRDKCRLANTAPPTVCLAWTGGYIAIQNVLSKYVGTWFSAGNRPPSEMPYPGIHEIKTFAGLVLFETMLLRTGPRVAPIDIFTSDHYIGSYIYSAPSRTRKSEDYYSRQRDVKGWALDGPTAKYTITLEEGIKALGRFKHEPDGTLSDDHETLAGRCSGFRDAENPPDPFLHFEDGAWKTCRRFGHLSPSVMPPELFERVVETTWAACLGEKTQTTVPATLVADSIFNFFRAYFGGILTDEFLGFLINYVGGRGPGGPPNPEYYAHEYFHKVENVTHASCFPDSGLGDVARVYDRALRLVVFSLQLTKKTFMWMIRRNIVWPFTIVYAAPFGHLTCGHYLFTVPGVGRMFYANASTTADQDAIQRVVQYHFAMIAGAGILEPHSVWVKRNAGFVKRGGGFGSTFFSVCREGTDRVGSGEMRMEQAALQFEREVTDGSGSLLAILRPGTDGFSSPMESLLDITGTAENIGGFGGSRYCGSLWACFRFGLPRSSALAIHDPALAPLLSTSRGQLNTCCWPGWMETDDGETKLENKSELGPMTSRTADMTNGKGIFNDLAGQLSMFAPPPVHG